MRLDADAPMTSLHEPVRADAGWRPQDIVCPGASPGGTLRPCSRQIASRAEVPRRCVAVAPRRRGTSALHAIFCVRIVQEPEGVSPHPCAFMLSHERAPRCSWGGSVASAARQLRSKGQPQ